ncbi:hypothetical protein [Patiriisocius hiemis]|uniref:Uncharacterized protein n=1 Tax=Patiriisocius hiemis TaxID=3075604 RepID=A0ABU2YB50_9FLAO|nr:hypothetical protein [Constantimarinum sp. W242]MDT0554972.1 hypothetical protein [Constantimarinum sp. W242]
MKNDIEKIFKDLDGSFDVHETPLGHQSRFLAKLDNNRKAPVKKINWWKPLSIAASLTLLVTLGFNFFTSKDQVSGELASVSPEMEKTQSFFITTINKEVLKLKSFENAETKVLIDDALLQINTLEKEYQGLKKDLIESGNDKRVIYAMITNFQKRVDLLEQVITTIEEIETLKELKNETII